VGDRLNLKQESCRRFLIRRSRRCRGTAGGRGETIFTT